MTTIAEYSAHPVNPFNAWLVDHVTPSVHTFVLLAVRLSRLVDEGRMSPAVMFGRLETEITEGHYDRAEVSDAWCAYEEFKIELYAYREAQRNKTEGPVA